MKTDLKQSLNRAVDQLPHPSFRDIADPPVIKMETMDRFAAQEEKSRRKDWKQFYRYAVPVFLCLLLLLPGFGYVRSNLLVDGIIDLDVNPSIEITINRRDRVLQVTGLNEEAVEILAGTDYRTWDVRDAVGDLILRLNDKQYISRNQRTVLLSVDSKNPEKAERIKQELSASIEAALAGTEIQPLVVRQSRPKDRDLQKRANEYHISSGKCVWWKKPHGRPRTGMSGSWPGRRWMSSTVCCETVEAAGRTGWKRTGMRTGTATIRTVTMTTRTGMKKGPAGMMPAGMMTTGMMTTGMTMIGTMPTGPTLIGTMTTGTTTRTTMTAGLTMTGIQTVILKRKVPAKRRERIPTIPTAEDTIPAAMTAMRMMIKTMIKTANVL